jgi:hypothetical protein
MGELGVMGRYVCVAFTLILLDNKKGPHVDVAKVFENVGKHAYVRPNNSQQSLSCHGQALGILRMLHGD